LAELQAEFCFLGVGGIESSWDLYVGKSVFDTRILRRFSTGVKHGNVILQINRTFSSSEHLHYGLLSNLLAVETGELTRQPNGIFTALYSDF
jgi:hypothetical protein